MTLTEAQLAERPNQLGGSDMASILGWTTTRTAYQTWKRKTGRDTESRRETEEMEWGSVLERPILLHCAEKFGEPIEPKSDTIRDEEYPFLVATVDGLSPDGLTIYEVKCVSVFVAKRDWSLGEEDGVPIYYITQAAHYLGIRRDAERVVFFVLVGGNKLHRFEITRAACGDLIATNRAFAVSWWFDHVVADVPPDPVNSRDAADLWRQAEDAKTIAPTPEIVGAFEQLNTIRRRIKADTALAEPLAVTIQNYMGDAEILPINDREEVTWKRTKTGRMFRGPWSNR